VTVSSDERTTVLVVDDSAFMRRLTTQIIDASGDFRVIGTARNGMDALRQIDHLDPALVTLDVEMPELDGLQTLGYIMSETPRPVVMLSAAQTVGGADLTLRCLELGAVDFIRKPSGPISLDLDLVSQQLLAALRSAKEVNLRGVDLLARPPRVEKSPEPANGTSADFAVAIAASTGGPRALAEVIPNLPANLDAAVFVVQHMPAGFTQSLAQRLNAMSRLSVTEAKADEPVYRNRVYLAPGGRHMRVVNEGGVRRIALDDGPAIWGVRPAADPLFTSIAQSFARKAVGVVLTGMGRDASEGLHAIRRGGGGAIVQDRASSIIYGMPQAALLHTGADREAPLVEVAPAIVDLLATRRVGHT
jgi:two-component system chemotaxis response regulator CheB